MNDRAAQWETPFPDNITLKDLIEAQVSLRPERIAVLCDRDEMGAPLTYGELNARANQVARRLRAAGVTAGDIVPVMMERSPALIVGIFAVIKAGAAYMPVLPDTPRERLRYMLADSRARVLLSDRAVDCGVDVISLEDPALYLGDATNVEPAGGHRDLAYVIYTSGSTGRPKGVMIEHRSVVNRLDWMQRAYPIGEDDVLLQKTSVAFDVSVWELFWWALCGAKLCLLRPGGERNPLAIADAVRRHRVSVLHFVPSMLNVFLEYMSGKGDRVAADFKSVRRVFTSGEALTPSHVRKFNDALGSNTNARLTNLYGPTEATVDVTAFDCPAHNDLHVVPIGRPIQNTRAYVIHHGRLAPVGSAGELCIAGVCLARGYLNDPALTAAKFVENPIVPGERVYRTGDVARWLSDGNLEYLGREDQQIKIRGMRIELGEIENLMREYPEVADSVVDVERQGENVVRIVGYVVWRTECDAEGLKKYLGTRLPAHMIPNRFETIERIPLTANGKANRAALRARPIHPEPV